MIIAVTGFSFGSRELAHVRLSAAPFKPDRNVEGEHPARPDFALVPLSVIRSFPTVSPGTRSGEIPAPGGTPPRIQASQKPRFWLPRKKRGSPKNFALSAALGFSSFASAGERHLSLYGAR
jgi:hypothetical protein